MTGGECVSSSFWADYPDGKYAANAHYWLGELYLVIDPPDLESSRQSFSAAAKPSIPTTPRQPDAMYKLGKVQFMKGNREKPGSTSTRVIREYGNSAIAPP